MNEYRLNGWQHVLIFALVVATIISRRPDALLNPQFYAEDGEVWFADAWNQGWLHSLTLVAGGYLNTLPRLVCGLAILIPLKSSPLVLNWFGIVIQAFPVNVLLTARCANWGSLWLRVCQAALYVVLPNSGELNVTITNAHWHLALAGCLLVFANPPGTWAWKALDLVVLMLIGLTGPWAIVITPLVLAFWWFRRQQWSLVMAALLAVCAAIQTCELLRNTNGRPTTPLGATWELFTRLIAGQVYVGAIWGMNSFAVRSDIALVLIVFATGSIILVWGIVTLRLEMKLFLVFSIMITAAALRSPLILANMPRWQALAIDKGARYWFFLMLALVWTLLWAAWQARAPGLRIFSAICFVVMLRAIYHDWHYWPYKDAKFGYYVKQFEAARPGTKVIFPLYPSGHEMDLIKR